MRNQRSIAGYPIALGRDAWRARERHGAAGLLYPPVSELREVSLRVAARVIRRAFADGVARSTKVAPEDAEAYVRAKAWQATYLPFERADD